MPPSAPFQTPCLAAQWRQAASALGRISPASLRGRVSGISARHVELAGLAPHLSIGDRVRFAAAEGCGAMGEIVGFRDDRTFAVPLGWLEGLRLGGEVTADLHERQAGLRVSDDWLGRVVDPLGAPLDGRGALGAGARRRLRADAPAATSRARLGGVMDLGVKAMNLFTPCRLGQRLGLFAASGIGKSTLLAMLARNMQCDVAVIGLVGERGHEVRSFLEDDLGEGGLARSVVVVATSDAAAPLRRDAAYAALTIAEHFRDSGRNVLLLMDSVTRFCLALREIALAAGEPPATRGYPPSVFGELPRLLERAGPGPDAPGVGAISAIFTVLVEGDDHDEPVADAVRGALDGHVILDRRIGERGRYPAIDVLRSLSRTSAACLDARQAALAAAARRVLADYADVADLVRLGAYRPGGDPAADAAVALAPAVEAVLRQERGEHVGIDESFAALAAALGEA